MICIVSGAIDSGKTARMERLFSACAPGTAAGFVSRKIFTRDRFRGYQLYSLADGREAPLALLHEGYGGQSIPGQRLGRFVFSMAGLELGEAIIEELLTTRFQGRIFIDEIGPLELRGLGFAPVLAKALRMGTAVTISIREDCLDEVTAEFGLRDYRLL